MVIFPLYTLVDSCGVIADCDPARAIRLFVVLEGWDVDHFKFLLALLFARKSELKYGSRITTETQRLGVKIA